jgi:hypothetical protein
MEEAQPEKRLRKPSARATDNGDPLAKKPTTKMNNSTSTNFSSALPLSITPPTQPSCTKERQTQLDEEEDPESDLEIRNLKPRKDSTLLLGPDDDEDSDPLSDAPPASEVNLTVSRPSSRASSQITINVDTDSEEEGVDKEEELEAPEEDDSALIGTPTLMWLIKILTSF